MWASKDSIYMLEDQQSSPLDSVQATNFVNAGRSAIFGPDNAGSMKADRLNMDVKQSQA